MRTWIAVTVFIALVVAFVPLPRPGTIGVYNSWSDTFWCTTHVSCVHEIGHMLDDRSGMISQTPAFLAVAENYTIVKVRTADGRPDGRELEELYASLFAGVDGHVERLRPPLIQFYNQDLADQLMATYSK